MGLERVLGKHRTSFACLHGEKWGGTNVSAEVRPLPDEGGGRPSHKEANIGENARGYPAHDPNLVMRSLPRNTPTRRNLQAGRQRIVAYCSNL